MNLGRSRYFKQDANCGQWVDAMVRLEGRDRLAAGVDHARRLDAGNGRVPLDQLMATTGLGSAQPCGNEDVQVVPSGPGESGGWRCGSFLAVINSAQKELVLTTPVLRA